MSPAPRERALGLALREAREDKGVRLRELADKIGRPAGTLSRWETGARAPQPTDVAQVLTSLGVAGPRYDEIVAMASAVDASQWLAMSLPEMQQQLTTLLDIERTATRCTDVSPLLIPGLLQTADYARAIMTSGHGVPLGEVETRVAVRLGRRDAITRSGPIEMVAAIGEAVLVQEIGGHMVMAAQLTHLLEMSKRPNVEVRVIPTRSGWNPAMEGPFLLVESADTTSVVHIENRRSGLFLHRKHDVDLYREATELVLNTAMSPEDSSGLIAKEINNHLEMA
jgi:transcriptional regulator with XRE-family HTH domain